MTTSTFRQNLKPWMLPIAMAIGIIFHEYIGMVAFLSPYLIFIMLLITFCKVSPKDFKVTPFIWALLSVQIAGAVVVYLALAPASSTIAQGVFICVLCPTATAAPVITGMLGGSITLLATYSLFSNVAVALLAPVLFSWIGSSPDISFAESMLTISSKVFPLILSPLALAFLFRAFAPKVHSAIARRQSLSFYIWAVSLIIVVGNAVSFVMKEPPSMIPEMLLIAFGSLIVCCLQFLVGRRIGAKLGDKISGAQGLGQKNTVLAIWMALTYLNPVSSVGPAAYVAWQNTINSLQLFYKTRKSLKKQNF